MATLIFLLTFLSVFILLIILITKAIRRRPTRKITKSIVFIVLAYACVWLAFYFKSTYLTVPLGTDVCFDDWCATILTIENGPDIQKQFAVISVDSTWIILDIRMSNHARGIAQKPSEPRIHILDNSGASWGYSLKGQQLLEKIVGKQTSIDQKLELHQSLCTKIVYSVPRGADGLKALIEEGPFVTKLLFPGDNSVFAIVK